jgi:hypothetical protein
MTLAEVDLDFQLEHFVTGPLRPDLCTEGDWITGQQFNPNGGMYM